MCNVCTASTHAANINELQIHLRRMEMRNVQDGIYRIQGLGFLVKQK